MGESLRTARKPNHSTLRLPCSQMIALVIAEKKNTPAKWQSFHLLPEFFLYIIPCLGLRHLFWKCQGRSESTSAPTLDGNLDCWQMCRHFLLTNCIHHVARLLQVPWTFEHETTWEKYCKIPPLFLFRLFCIFLNNNAHPMKHSRSIVLIPFHVLVQDLREENNKLRARSSLRSPPIKNYFPPDPPIVWVLSHLRSSSQTTTALSRQFTSNMCINSCCGWTQYVYRVLGGSDLFHNNLTSDLGVSFTDRSFIPVPGSTRFLFLVK